jgi:hypothetical protein
MKNIALIVGAVVLVTLVHNYDVQAKGTDNPIINTVETIKDKATNNKVTNFVKKEWTETKEFQKNSWAEGQQQVQRNKEQLVGMWENITGAWVYYFQPEDLVDNNTHSVQD